MTLMMMIIMVMTMIMNDDAAAAAAGAISVLFVQVFLFASPPPADLYCPLTGKILEDPLLTPYGSTFSGKAIRAHVRVHQSCPLTGQPLAECVALDIFSDQSRRMTEPGPHHLIVNGAR